MDTSNNADEIYRHYVHATEQQLYASGVEYATSVEYIPDRQVFLIYEFNRNATEWIVDVPAEWAAKFLEKYNIAPIELFSSDVVRNEEDAVYVTNHCARRIYTSEIHKTFEGIMERIGYNKPCPSEI